MDRQQIIQKLGTPGIGSEAAALLNALESGRQIDYCTSCLRLVHASLFCTCGNAAVTVSAQPVPDAQMAAAHLAAAKVPKTWV